MNMARDRYRISTHASTLKSIGPVVGPAFRSFCTEPTQSGKKYPENFLTSGSREHSTGKGRVAASIPGARHLSVDLQPVDQPMVKERTGCVLLL